MKDDTPRVMIMEDDDALRSVLADALRAEHIDVAEAKDGEKGLRETGSFKPDLVLLDILMPRMDGKAVFKALRGNSETKHIPVSFLTNLSSMESISEAIGDEKADYIIKSDWSIDEIVKHVKEKLRTKN